MSHTESRGWLQILIVTFVLVATAMVVLLFALIIISEAPVLIVGNQFTSEWKAEYIQRASTPTGGMGLYKIEHPKFSAVPDSERFEALKDRINSAISDGQIYELVAAYCEFRGEGAPYDADDFAIVLNAVSRGSWNWGPGRGEDRVRLWRPLVEILDGTDFEFPLKAELALGLMESSERDRAIEL